MTMLAPTPGIGHNSAPDAQNETDLEAEAAAMLAVPGGAIVATLEQLVIAINDKRMKRGHLQVLGQIALHINSKTATAWMSRQTIADALGWEVETVEKRLYEMRALGHLFWESRPNPKGRGRPLLQYTFPLSRRETLQAHITAFVTALRAERQGTPPVGQVPQSRGSSEIGLPHRQECEVPHPWGSVTSDREPNKNNPVGESATSSLGFRIQTTQKGDGAEANLQVHQFGTTENYIGPPSATHTSSWRPPQDVLDRYFRLATDWGLRPNDSRRGLGLVQRDASDQSCVGQLVAYADTPPDIAMTAMQITLGYAATKNAENLAQGADNKAIRAGLGAFENFFRKVFADKLRDLRNDRAQVLADLAMHEAILGKRMNGALNGNGGAARQRSSAKSESSIWDKYGNDEEI
jgi:hypothetical protein